MIFAHGGSFIDWLRLAKPIEGFFGDETAIVLDIGSGGAYLSVERLLAPGTQSRLKFSSLGQRVTVDGTVTAVAAHEAKDQIAAEYFVVVRFRGYSESADRFIDAYRAQIERAERANLNGVIEANVLDGDRQLAHLGAALRERAGTLVRCTFSTSGRWHVEEVSSVEQPADGFTVIAAEDQIRLLQLAYEDSDEAGRQLIRRFAASTFLNHDS